MCVLIDICCIPRVFDQGNKEHDDFAPILEWITPPNRGSMVYGGSTYRKELERAGKYIKIINALKTGGRVVKLNDKEVDDIEREVRRKINDRYCDDPHLIAIVIASKCAVVCTCDDRALPYLKQSDLYQPHGSKRPKIYKRKKHCTLCRDENIVGRCLK